MKNFFYVFTLSLFTLWLCAMSISANARVVCPTGTTPSGSGSLCVPDGSSGGNWSPTIPSPTPEGGGIGGSGAGGSWGNDGGFSGNGGSIPTTSSGDDQACYAVGGYAGASWGKSAACSKYMSNYGQTGFSVRGNFCSNGGNHSDKYFRVIPSSNCGGNPPPPPPECPSDSYWNGTSCVPTLKCPVGYKKEGNKCIWQCPAGFKEVAGSCVKDDMPEDCDPLIQECDENGKPKCDPCSKLQQLINNNLTMINNDNRIISLSETAISNQNITNNTLNSVNNNISNVNNNLTSINNNMYTVNNSITNLGDKIDNVITAINNNSPNFDTSAIEAKLDAVIQAINNQNGEDGNGDPLDLSEMIRLLTELNQNVLDNKFDDTQLNEALDTIINEGIPVGVNWKPLFDKMDKQTGLLEDIKKLLQPTLDAELAPSLEDVEFDATIDPWSSIRSFDVNQNMINAQALCPADSHGFSFFGKQFTFPMATLCAGLGQISIGIMFLAYIGGAFIIVKGD